jgi:hypothetical protein
MKNATAKTVTTEVHFEVADEVVISDPCYLERADENGYGVLTWGDGMHKISAHPGEWLAVIETADNSETHGWGERVSKLIAEYKGGGRLTHRDEQLGYAAVDSGQMFIGAAEGLPIDYDALLALYYTGDLISGDEPGPPSPTGRKWVNHQMLACQTGAVSSTGYGDGTYEVTVGRDSDGQVVYIEVDFFGEEEDEYTCQSCGSYVSSGEDYCDACAEDDEEDDDE